MEAVSVASRLPLAGAALRSASTLQRPRSRSSAISPVPIHARIKKEHAPLAGALHRSQPLHRSCNSPSLEAFAAPSAPVRRFRRDASVRASAAAAAAGEGKEPEVLAVPFTAAAPAAPVRKFLGTEITTLKKVVPLGLMFFCILFNYTILRDTKDVLVVTAPGSGAEIIPFLKTWVNLPAAVGFAILYADLANKLSKEALFYSCILPFIAFFGAFAFVMYPLRDVLHPTAFVDGILASVGPVWAPRLAAPLSILRNWTFCVFYVAAELWGSVVVSVLFWGFANQIMVVDEASQWYPLFGLGANVALVVSGRVVKYFSNVRATLKPGVDGWALSLRYMMGLVVIMGLVITGIYAFTNKVLLKDPNVKLPTGGGKKKKEKTKLGFGESVKFLLNSRYIRDLACLVVAYGISINLVEVTWKSKIKAQFPNPNDYSAFMGDFSSATGAVTFGMMLLSRVIFRKFGWGVAAQITPVVLLLTGVAFFGLLLFGGPIAPWLASVGMTPLLAAVYVGALQNIFSKSAKYSLFDPCKEMAYIPLDDETKVKGKAAIDVVCNPMGKSGGAAIQQVLIIVFGSLANSTPYLGAILLGIVSLWIMAARSLDSQFKPMVHKGIKTQLSEGKLEALSARLLGANRGRQQRSHRFVSVLNEQGYIEGRYVPIDDDSRATSKTAPAPIPVSRSSENGNGPVAPTDVVGATPTAPVGSQ